MTLPVPYGGMLRRDVCPSRNAGAARRAFPPDMPIQEQRVCQPKDRQTSDFDTDLRRPMLIAPASGLLSR